MNAGKAVSVSVSASDTIAVLGAPGTGAAEMAAALTARLASNTPALQVVYAHRHVMVDDAALTLLMGLDVPCPAAEQRPREAIDQQLRQALDARNIPYQVVYGQGPQRLDNALVAIKSIASRDSLALTSARFDSEFARLRAWSCEKCSDPECELRLFTSLTHRTAQGEAEVHPQGSRLP